MLYVRYVKLWAKSLVQYPGSFWMMTIGQFIVSLGGFIGMVVLFGRFGNIKGWTFSEVALCYAVTNLAFNVGECFARGFDTFSTMVRSGGFDRVLLRPAGTVAQVMGARIEFSKVGRIVQAAVIMAVAVAGIPGWTPLKALGLFLMVASGVVIYTGVSILGATASFWIVQGLEIVNVFKDGGREVASYPIEIFGAPLAKFFTYVLPFACFNYLPLMFLTGRSDRVLLLLAPVLGMLFLIPCVGIWHLGTRYYASTGS